MAGDSEVSLVAPYARCHQAAIEVAERLRRLASMPQTSYVFLVPGLRIFESLVLL